MRTHVVVAMFASLAGALLVGPQALAQDAKTQSGSNCITNQLRSTAGITGVIYNFSTAAAFYECPVVRDSHGTNTLLSGSFSHIIDTDANSDATCVLYSVDSSQPLTLWFDAQTTSGSSSTPQVLTHGALTTVNQGYYQYACLIPGVNSNLSGIVSYRIREL